MFAPVSYTHLDVYKRQVLIVPKDSDGKITSFEDAAGEEVPMIAIGNEDVPVGQYTEAIYQNLGLWEQNQEKANLASNVRQVLDLSLIHI